LNKKARQGKASPGFFIVMREDEEALIAPN
jgi:hypothetical protein